MEESGSSKSRLFEDRGFEDFFSCMFSYVKSAPSLFMTCCTYGCTVFPIRQKFGILSRILSFSFRY